MTSAVGRRAGGRKRRHLQRFTSLILITRLALGLWCIVMFCLLLHFPPFSRADDDNLRTGREKREDLVMQDDVDDDDVWLVCRGKAAFLASEEKVLEETPVSPANLRGTKGVLCDLERSRMGTKSWLSCNTARHGGRWWEAVEYVFWEQ